MTSSKARERKNGSMDLSMWASISKAKNTAGENYCSRTFPPMKGSFRQTKFMGKALFSGLTIAPTTGIGCKARWRAPELYSGQMAKNSRGSSRLI